MTELWQRCAYDLADLIRTGEASSREIVDAHLERIEAINPKLNAIVEVLTTTARAGADTADRAIAAGRNADGSAIGSLHGVPVTIKQNIDVAGTATTLGLTVFKDAVAPSDGPPVERLREAGAIVVGRTNMPDVALRWHTDSGLAGATINPWNAAISPGGSSGGEAVAIATGMSPLGVGTDLGGSVRIPAAACGVASLKVTWGRVADTSVIAPPPTEAIALMDTTGPLARRVADLRIAFDVLSGPSDRDPRYRNVDASVASEPSAFCLHVPRSTHADIAAALEHAARQLEADGWIRHEVDGPDFDAARILWLELIHHDVDQSLPMLAAVCSDNAMQYIESIRSLMTPLDNEQFAIRLERRLELIDEWAGFQATTPVILTPVMSQPTFAAGADLSDPFGVFDSVSCITPVNVLGLPAAVVPIGATAGMPIGAHLIGPAWREDLCLLAAEAIERGFDATTPINPR